MASPAPDPKIQQRIDLEADIIDSAMRLVAAGVADRTIVAGLRSTDAALTVALGKATGLGVRVETIGRVDDEGRDVVVTRIGGSGRLDA